MLTRVRSIVAIGLALLPTAARGDVRATTHRTAPASPVELPDPGEAPPPDPAADPTGPSVPEPTEIPPVPVDPPPADPSRPPDGPTPPPDDPARPVEDPAATGGDAAIVAIDLEWRTVVGCPAADRVLVVTGALLGRSLAIDPTASLVVRADVVNDGTRFVADLDIDGPGGATRRQLHATDCGALTEAVALVVATNVDPRAVAAILAGERPAEEGDTAPRRRPPPDDRNAQRTTGARRIGVALSIQGGPAVGVAPRITGWLQAGLSMSYGRAQVGVYGGHGFARTDARVDTLRASLSSGGVRGCFVPTQGRVAVPLCGLAEGGAVVARDRRGGGRSVSGWAGLGAGAGIEWAPHPRIALQGNVDAIAALTRPELVVTDDDGERTSVVFAPAVVRVLLGIAVRLR